ncbi:MAG TPA: tetratricopeptide repeat-containing diguanylate cyclase [Steroidobacteraceae bacterium]|nr:tetratricopeptide repeat-containing diguanylate cyclase [Steroidobacteraceae bacterium]
MTVLAGVATPCIVGAASAVNPAVSFIEHGVIEMRTDPEASRRDAEAALQSLQRQPDVDLEIQARLILCDYQAERDTRAALEQIEAATALLPQAQRKGIQAGLLDCRGEIFETAGDNTRARGLYEQAVAVATSTHDEEMLAQSLFSRGYLLGLQGEYAAGLADLKRAQSLFDRLNKPLHSLTTLNSIAILYNRMGDYAEARSIYSRALTAQRSAGMKRELVVTLHNLGRASENLHDWDDARQSFSESLALSRQLGYSRGEAYALRGLAAVSNASGDPKGALETLDRAMQLQQKTADARLLGQIQLARGVAYHKLQRLTESATALESALQIFLRADALGELNATYSELADVYAESGNWRAAFERQTHAKLTSEKLLGNQLDQRFAALKVEFDTASKEKENAALMRENQANEKALAQGRAVRHLQAAVIALSAALVLVLALLAVYQRRSALRLRHLAMTDELTGVPNRRSVLRRLEPLLKDSLKSCSALIIDIDHFKKINDQLGHPIGDEVLKVVAARLRASVVEPAFFGRLGGEEFLIVLPATGLEEARMAAESFREEILTVDTAHWFGEEARHITASVGCTVSTPGEDSPSTILKRADAALYAAKRSGRNCVRTEPAVQQEFPSLLIGTQ